MIYLNKTNDMSSRLSEAHGEISPLTSFSRPFGSERAKLERGRDDKKNIQLILGKHLVHKRNFVTCDFVTLRYYQIIRARKNTELYIL